MPGPIALAAIPAIAHVAGSVIGALGQRSANAANAREAARNREWQTDMANTQWQRGVADMKAAGMNPALAYQQGGAATGAGAQATHQNTMQSVGPGIAGATQAVIQAAEAKARIEQTQAQTSKIQAEEEAIRGTLWDQIAELRARATLHGQSANAAQASANEAGARTRLHRWEAQFRENTKHDAYRLEGMRLSNKLTEASAFDTMIRAKLGMQGLQHEFFRENLAPWLNDATAVAKAFWEFSPKGVRINSTKNTTVYDNKKVNNSQGGDIYVP